MAVGRGSMNLFLARAVGLLVVVFWTTAPYAAESKPNWQAEWERTVQAAKKEGSLSLYLFQGEGELGTVVQLFQKKYPEINVVTTLGRGNTLAPRIMAERRAGKYLVDVYISGVTTAYEVFYRAKILNSVRAALILPEVTDESKWWLGQHQYVDPENRYILPLSRQRRRVCFVQYQVGGGGRDSFLLGFSPTQVERKNSLARSEDFRQPKNRSARCITTRRSWARSLFGVFTARWT